MQESSQQPSDKNSAAPFWEPHFTSRLVSLLILMCYLFSVILSQVALFPKHVKDEIRLERFPYLAFKCLLIATARARFPCPSNYSTYQQKTLRNSFFDYLLHPIELTHDCLIYCPAGKVVRAHFWCLLLFFSFDHSFWSRNLFKNRIRTIDFTALPHPGNLKRM